MKGEGFLARWSRRKTQARAAPSTASAAEPAPAASPAATTGALQPPSAPPEPLPPLESLTPQSDFAPFMRAGVDPTLKGQALKTLFGDPALYPMDGLDVYIDDYARPDPLPEGLLGRLNQFAALDGPPPDPPAPEQSPEAGAPLPDPVQGARNDPGPGASDTSDAGTSPSGSMNRSAT